MNNHYVLPILVALAACAAAPVVPHMPPPPRTESPLPVVIDEPARSERYAAIEPGTRVAPPEFPWLRRHEVQDYDTTASTAAIESPDAVIPQAGDDVAAAGDVDVVTWAPSVPYGYHPLFRSRRHHVVFLPPPPEVVGLAVGLDHRLHHDLHRAMARGAVHAAHALRGLFRALH